MLTYKQLENAQKFFGYAKERYKIFLKREAGESIPWTKDRILQIYRFCNVFREDDVVTKYIRKNISLEIYGDHLVGVAVMSRIFNKPSTLQKLIEDENNKANPDLLGAWTYLRHEVWANLVRERLEGVQPIISAAYIIATKPGMNKLDGILHCLEPVLANAVQLQKEMQKEGCTLQYACELLQQFSHIGPFIAYEIVTDLRHSILKNAPDIMTWANPGPGATRGLGRILEKGPKHFSRTSPKSVAQMMIHMQELLELSKDERFWDQSYPSWEMREVEHTLCEFDKYERARLGEGKPKQAYPGRIMIFNK
jgi:hypothetical protein